MHMLAWPVLAESNRCVSASVAPARGRGPHPHPQGAVEKGVTTGGARSP
jgi:hypothetical protein